MTASKPQGNNQANNNNVNNNGAAFTADQIIGTDSQPLKEKSAKALSFLVNLIVLGVTQGGQLERNFKT